MNLRNECQRGKFILMTTIFRFYLIAVKGNDLCYAYFITT